MWVRIEHTTAFSYESPVAEAQLELRLKPATDGGQRCWSFDLSVEPSRPTILGYTDSFGNDVQHLDVLELHTRLAVKATSEVSTAERFVDGRPLSLLEQYDYLRPTGRIPLDGPIAELTAAGEAGDSPHARAVELMRAVRGRLVYETGATHVDTRADEALAAGHGVCQDFAHVLIGACRSTGIPARYVSGYLYDPEPVTHQASHAWVDVFCPERGWLSLDPTHDREQNELYVRVGVGRDYSDVPPTRGVYKGTAEERLDVAVLVRAV